MNVGSRSFQVADPVQGARIPVWTLYPTSAPERPEQLGLYRLDVATSAPIEGERLPLVVVSHGTGGSPWPYRGIAVHLVRSGFVVALIEHPGNSRSDDSLAGTPANLENRPRHVRLVLDALFADEHLAPRLSTQGVGVIGHSLGGYTALAVAGGRPWSFPHESPDGKAHPVPVVHDPRVRALVLLTPAAPWFAMEGALTGVDLPILLRMGELDTFAPPLNAQIVLNGVKDPARVDHRVVAGAGHFSFQSPFPPAMVRPDFLPAHDPPGFDRVAYQPILHAEILAFLRASLGVEG